MSRYRIAFITCSPDKLDYYFPTAAEPDFVSTEKPFTPDDEIVVRTLRERGHKVSPVIWGEDVEKLKVYDLVVMRSPWDYMDSQQHRTRFTDWLYQLDQHGVNLENNPAFIRWLIDKHYLRDLQNGGVSIVPTEYVEQGDRRDLSELFKTQGALVVKPCISAAGDGLVHIKDQATADSFQSEFDRLCTEKAYMIQPFIEEVCTAGEWSLIYLDGSYSHAVLKKPCQGSILVHGEFGGSLDFDTPPAAIKEFCDRACSFILPVFKKTDYYRLSKTKLCFEPLYLRIDVIESKDGLLVSECEGVEPELFFRAKGGSEEIFCNAITKRLSE